MEMKKDMSTTPPSTPQGPARNDLLTNEPYRSGPYPGDDPAHATGEGSAGSSHPTAMPDAPHSAPPKRKEPVTDDVTAPQPPDNVSSTSADPDHERPGGMSGGLGAGGKVKGG
jgi:hypothetical protein